MFIPTPFQLKDKEKLYQIIDAYGFATVISLHEGAPTATQLPLILDMEKRYLYGHFSRANPQWRSIDQQRILTTFQGPHCYISSSWYETKNAVPTWNYITVHVHGYVELINEEELKDSLHQLILKYETPDSSYKLDEVDPNYVENLTKGIVGFKVKIDTLEGKAKLSQNHSQERRDLVIHQLEQSLHENEQKIAFYMKHNL